MLTALVDGEDEQHIARLLEGLAQIGIILRQRRPDALVLGQLDIVAVVGFDQKEASIAKQIVQLGHVVIGFLGTATAILLRRGAL